MADDKSLAERAAEYQLRRECSGADHPPVRQEVSRRWSGCRTDQTKAYVAAESECERLTAENARLKAALRRLGAIEGREGKD
jgi:hypothetical protein